VEQITAFGAPVDPDVKRRINVERGSSPSAVASTGASRYLASRPAYSEPPASRIFDTPLPMPSRRPP
jgi:hypothetical protein